jgi:Fe-Mn family superoxide dismutase
MKNILLQVVLFSFLGMSFSAQAVDSPPPFSLPPLPYEKTALEPYISERTLTFHYGKHHQGYVDTLNKLVKEKGIKGTLEEVIISSAQDPDLKSVFNNAAQDWNHTFYWSSMMVKGGGQPKGPILDLIVKTFGSYDEFKKQFIEAGTKLFGSGWVWLVQDKDNSLKIIGTKDADLPLVHDQKALLTCDIWEHAYYLDYQNRRKDYVEVFLDHLVNWDFANQNLSK